MESRILKRDCKKRECNNARKCRKNEDIPLYIFEFNTTTIYWAPELIFSRQSLLPLCFWGTFLSGIYEKYAKVQKRLKSSSKILATSIWHQIYHAFTWGIMIFLTEEEYERNFISLICIIQKKQRNDWFWKLQVSLMFLMQDNNIWDIIL